MDLVDVEHSKVTADGWILRVSLTQIEINSVPNMAATAFTWEGFVTGTATLTLDGSGDNIDVESCALCVWAQRGCEDQSSNGVLGSSQVGRSVNKIVSPTETAGTAEMPDEAPAPQTQVTTLPSRTTELILGCKTSTLQDGRLREGDQMQLEKVEDSLVVSFYNFHVEVGSCREPVFIRLHARAWMSPSPSDDTVDVYSDVVPLRFPSPAAVSASADRVGRMAARGGEPEKFVCIQGMEYEWDGQCYVGTGRDC